MEVLMPSAPLDSNSLSECKEDIEFDDFFLAKLAYINTNSDLDVFQLQGDQRIQHLICAWNTGYVLCRRCDSEHRSLPGFLKNFITNLVHYSMNLWFSLEWEMCDFSLCCSLLVSMFRLRLKLLDVPCLAKLNWNHVMNIGIRPWEGTYFKEYMQKIDSADNNNSSGLTFSVETVEPPATLNDVVHIKEEGYILTLLRLMKLFDAGCMESVKRFSIVAISAWNQEQQKLLHNSNNDYTISYDEDLKRCLNMICHTHLMAVFERDSAVGFEIDNMINNIRFYHKCICDAQLAGKSISSYNHQTHVTPSHLFALTCFRLNQSVQDFIESVLSDLARESCNTLFGAVSHAYATYLLASVLVEMNKFNTGDFMANVDKYKKTMRAFVVERERSERFILDEVHKQKLQRTSHNVNCTVKEITNLKAAIAKGNHSSNLVNHKPMDVQSEQERAELFETENEKRYDPVFQTMPNNEIVTNEFYDVLSKTKYKGWHFAKLVLLLKIIGRELNDIEKWCYHPGLTTQFMMGLEYRLAKRFEDLALIFQDHIFMEQEFWLTAFYLRPVRPYYDKVIYCGTRFHRTVNFLNKGDRGEIILKPTDKSAKNANEVSCAFMNAKYGLLSSTFDVKQIAQMTCVDTAENDYEVLAKALRLLRLPENIIKDLLTVTFSPRHANFTWAAEWPILRKRCKMLLSNPVYKRELVESNMAEANDRLKYLKVDYDKYKNWPQLDYGTIEEGYENDYIGDDIDDTDDEDDSDDDANKKKGRQTRDKTKDETDEFDHFETKNMESFQHEVKNEFENCGILKRSSARRAAAVIASAMLKEDANMKFLKRRDDTPKSANIIAHKDDNDRIQIQKATPVNSTTEDGSMDNTKKLEDSKDNCTDGLISNMDIKTHCKQDKNPSQLLEEFSVATSGFIKKMSDLCRRTANDDINDESSRSDTESSNGQQSIPDTMNVSDNETSNSSSDDNQRNGWEKLLPSFIVEHSVQSRMHVNVGNDNKFEYDGRMKIGNRNEPNRSCVAKDLQNDNKTICGENMGKLAKSDSVGAEKLHFGNDFAPASIESGWRQLSEKLEATDHLPEKKTASLTVAVAPTDCIDTLSKHKTSIGIESKNEEFIVSETTRTSSSTTRETNDNVVQDETVDSIACSKTENHESNDKTITEDSNGRTHKNENANIEVHSTTEIDAFKNKQTGKPKSFSEMLSAQLLNDDSTSQSSNGTQPHSVKLEGSTNTSEGPESNMDDKRKEELIQLCLQRKCFVQLDKPINLKNSSVKLEPIVRLKRFNLDKFYEEKATRQKRTTTKPKNFYMEDNTSPIPHTNSKTRKRRHDSSASTCSDEESDEEYKPKIAKESSRSTNRKLPITKKDLSEKQQRNRAKNFSVVPRSASGLKVCISSLCDIRPPNDCIEISSSSDGEMMDVNPYPVEFANINSLIADEDDPLFEEEADIDLLR